MHHVKFTVVIPAFHLTSSPLSPYYLRYDSFFVFSLIAFFQSTLLLSSLVSPCYYLHYRNRLNYSPATGHFYCLNSRTREMSYIIVSYVERCNVGRYSSLNASWMFPLSFSKFSLIITGEEYYGIKISSKTKSETYVHRKNRVIPKENLQDDSTRE